LTANYFQIFRNKHIFSSFLKREVRYDLLLPLDFDPKSRLPTLYMNDGQDLDKLVPQSLGAKHHQNGGRPFVWVAIHTNDRRLREYGTSHVPDYKGRGDLATAHMQFVTEELMPEIQKTTPSSVTADDNLYCGFSLGGLSAFDTVWENPTRFSKAGVFSGALWWRSKSYEAGYDQDLDRIMHNKVKSGSYKPGLSFWFECGTCDEKEDRNNNGIIDSIDDTLELMEELRKKGYSENALTYLEIKGGEHNFNTWQAAFPSFLSWAL
jgi:enterochelin esterase-like enzyme